ncbi:SDR family oxidoreductase [Gleimia hominis]|uniref:SDR family oxidoreductase n=1 Tax=Gleimia hominis TaxID=595468 RepID=A0ABU3IAP5_9ACTO|nr:SDR family oxidoreductase [Gleimia hominis]MDT3767453.1 SDR family oxidoreductase [Gleimia hominis]
MSFAVVTGASSGIGRATAEQLKQQGWQVLAVARREERLHELAERIGCEYFAADLTKDEDVAALVDYAHGIGPVDAVANIAGGAIGVDPVADAQVERWQKMFDVNALSALRVSKAFLPQLRKHGGTLLFLTSTAAHGTYPGGGGYVAAKHAERAIVTTLRQELVGEPVRLIEIAPGMVHTPEFSLNRLGSQEAADAVYEGVEKPLTAEDVAEAVTWTLNLPSHFNVDTMIIRPVEQATHTVTKRMGSK